MIRNIFSSFKTKLQGQRWRNNSVQMVIEKVASPAHTIFFSFCFRFFFFNCVDFEKYLCLQVESLSPRLWTTKDASGEAELDLMFSKVHAKPPLFLVAERMEPSCTLFKFHAVKDFDNCTTFIPSGRSEELFLQLHPAAVCPAKEARQTVDCANSGCRHVSVCGASGLSPVIKLNN